MPVAVSQVGRLWGSPGRADASARELFTRAAAAHAVLVEGAASQSPRLRQQLSPLLTFLHSRSPITAKRKLLTHPLFIEGLHALAPAAPFLRRWHELVTASATAPTESDDVVLASLGHVTLSALLHTNRRWRGTHVCCTDVIGRVGFPFSDWTLCLKDDQGEFLPRLPVTLTLGAAEGTWRLADDTIPFLVMTRADCLHLILGGALSARARLHFPPSQVRPCLQRLTPLGTSGIRYDPVGFLDFDAHAGLTGGIVQQVVAAIRRHSPAVYRELCRFICTIRGFEFPESVHGTVGSFSDPTLPGVLGVNISYTPLHQPRLDPFCFTWFGHEMGHTKNYFVDTILFCEGRALVTNAPDSTGILPRYGRAFTVRTLFQIPYVHLYEWVLLMEFIEGRFTGLPWKVPDCVEAIGNDFAEEIHEAFDWIHDKAHLTPLGESALDHFRHLTDDANDRWRTLGFASPPSRRGLAGGGSLAYRNISEVQNTPP